VVQLERVLASRGGQFFAGNRLSWAELHFLQLVDLLSAQNEMVLDSCPKLANLVERTKALPNIKNYRNNRPVTEF